MHEENMVFKRKYKTENQKLRKGVELGSFNIFNCTNL